MLHACQKLMLLIISSTPQAYQAKRVLCLRQTGSAGWLVQKWRHQIYEITQTSHSFRSLALFKLTHSPARLATCRDDGLLKPVHISDISPRVFPIPSLAHGDNIQRHNQGQKLNNHRHTYWKWDSKNSYSRTIRAAAASAADNWWWRGEGARGNRKEVMNTPSMTLAASSHNATATAVAMIIWWRQPPVYRLQQNWVQNPCITDHSSFGLDIELLPIDACTIMLRCFCYNNVVAAHNFTSFLASELAN